MITSFKKPKGSIVRWAKRPDYFIAMLFALPLSLVHKYATSSVYSTWTHSKRDMPKLPDFWVFFRDGDSILSGHYKKVYQTSLDQAGSLQVTLDRLLAEIAHFISWPVFFWLLNVFILVSLSYLARSLVPLHYSGDVSSNAPFDNNAKSLEQKRTRASIIVILVASLAGLPVLIVDWGHWWQIPVFFLWWFSIRNLNFDKPIRAGLMTAVSIGLEPWAILGVLPISFSHKGWKSRIIYLSTSMLGLLFWLPFYLTPGFAFGKKHWAVFDSSLWGAWRVVGFTWTDRLIQGALVSLLACLTGILASKVALPSVWKAWILVATLGLLRIGLDSITFTYYWQGIALFLLAGVGAVWGNNNKEKWISSLLFLLTIPFWIPWNHLTKANAWAEPATFIGALLLLAGLVFLFLWKKKNKITLQEG